MDLAKIFPCSTPQESHLFKTLLHAYIDARYKEEYSIAGEQLRLLLQRVSLLHSIAERTCQDHFIKLENRVGELIKQPIENAPYGQRS